MNDRKRSGMLWMGIAVWLLLSFGLAGAERQPDVVVFTREACNDCRHMDEVLDGLLEIYPELYVIHIVDTEPGAADLMWTLSTEYGIFPSKYPVIFVGDLAIAGVGREKEIQLRNAVRLCVFEQCESPMSRIGRDPLPITTIGIMLVFILTAAVLLF